MPIRENNHWCSPAELLGEDRVATIAKLKASSGFDALRCAGFWESWAAVQLGGRQTSANHQFDVAVDFGGTEVGVEIKYSQAFWANFALVRDVDCSRHVWKWLVSHRQHYELPPDVLVLIGVDIDSRVYTYVLPHSALKGRSITVTAPSSRIGQRARLDDWLVPPTEMLPAVMRVYRDLSREAVA